MRSTKPKVYSLIKLSNPYLIKKKRENTSFLEEEDFTTDPTVIKGMLRGSYKEIYAILKEL